MATTQTSLTPTGIPFPYIGIGVPAAQLPTPIPSAEIIFVENNTAITVAAAGADQRLFINMALPRSFCYVLVESTMQIRGADSADWDDNAVCTIRDSDASAEAIIAVDYCNLGGGVGHTATTNVVKTYVARDIPNRLIIPRSVDDAFMEVDIFNAVIDGTVMAVYFFARFLRFDRNQSQFWQVNTPVLIR